jgi:ribosomal protein S18 acetylase RimI-like enzyme
MNVISLGYRTDLMLLELGGSTITAEDDRLIVRTPANPEYWWGNFLLYSAPVTAGQVQARLAEFAAAFPTARHVAWGIDGIDGTAYEPAAADEVRAAGFELETDTVMTATAVHRPADPAIDAEFRRFSGDADWAQALELRAAVNEGERSTRTFLEGQLRTARQLSENGHAAWFGAFHQGRLVSTLGIASDRRGLARYQNVETHPDWRRRGLAGRLVYEAGTFALTEQGAETLVMVADPGYTAIRLYRALGFADGETQAQLTRPPAATG